MLVIIGRLRPVFAFGNKVVQGGGVHTWGLKSHVREFKSTAGDGALAWQKLTFGLRTRVFIRLEKKGSEYEEEMVFCGYISEKKLRHVRFCHTKMFVFRFKLMRKRGCIVTGFSESHLLHTGRSAQCGSKNNNGVHSWCRIKHHRVKQLYSGANYVSVQLPYNYAALPSDVDVYIGLCLCLNWS